MKIEKVNQTDNIVVHRGCDQTGNIIVHRGRDQIGGNVVEIFTEKARILLDAGSELPDTEPGMPLDINVLLGERKVDAIFITHNHADHFGLLEEIDYAKHDVPIYMGTNAYTIYSEMQWYRYPLDGTPFSPTGALENGKPIRIGDITVTPFLVDHSAFDSYSLLVEADGRKIFYTGDFRSNGRKNFYAYLNRLPKKVDVLICEGTTLNRAGKTNMTEQEIETELADIMRRKTGPVFILQAGTNVDRLVSVYRAGKRTGRVLHEELFQANIMEKIGGSIPNPRTFEDVFTFLARGCDKNDPRGKAIYDRLSQFGNKKLSRAVIASQKPYSHFTMCIRQSMKGFLRKLSEERGDFANGALIYSLWPGYKKKEDMASFLDEMSTLGLELIDLHTSGHADEGTIRRLIKRLNPSEIVPVHTENSAWFETLSQV
jgi:ribonuclease J